MKTFKVKIFLISFLPLLFSSKLQCEYRVYQYFVFNKLNAATTPPIVNISTLNPSDFIKFHGGRDSVEIKLLRTWMCFGDTSLSDVCQADKDSVERYE